MERFLLEEQLTLVKWVFKFEIITLSDDHVKKDNFCSC
jgi:hypothetical protein